MRLVRYLNELVLLLPYDSRQNCLLKGRGSLECLKAAWHTELLVGRKGVHLRVSKDLSLY